MYDDFKLKKKHLVFWFTSKYFRALRVQSNTVFIGPVLFLNTADKWGPFAF